jgi:transcriptional regulator with XRE-family HTH domain
MQVEYENLIIASEIERVRETPGYVAAGLALKIAEKAHAELEEQGLTQTRLAELMEVSRAHVSSLLGAPTNMTLLTFAKLSLALGLMPDVDMYPISSIGRSKAQPSRLEDEAVAITTNNDVDLLYRVSALAQGQVTDATT